MNEVADPQRPVVEEPRGLWSRLKSETRATHEKLDGRIMAGRPFESRIHYGLFLLVQHDFHSIVSPLYGHADLAGMLPDLRSRDRLPTIEQDLRDLGLAVPNRLRSPRDYLLDIPGSLGWLYVAEGSNLGAAFLLKAARQLDLSETFGARHLAAAPEGRGLYWKTFTSALDAIELSAVDERRVIGGANDAFMRVLGFVERRFFDATAD
ncbi:heme oxygenase [Devosia yakushimensis]|uniref:Heme oxygenase n=1 Tax=Devosia yakushimensis TaxID=470028 RepID=A0ABQ5UHJ9_9HYPH|nr:biliverdin-producing heme oxygenase [Devosia yakushimensis]GLQ10675.1 heme oxygenase [Devosia yakushimensis]